MRDIGPQPSRFYLARHWQTRIRHIAVSGIWDNGSGRPPGIGRNLIADVSDDVRCDSEVGIWDNGSGRPPGIGRNLIADVSDDVRCDSEVGNDSRAGIGQGEHGWAFPLKRYLERLLANANTTWAMVRRRWPRWEMMERYCRAATVPGATAGQRQHHVGHGAAEMARSARPL